MKRRIVLSFGMPFQSEKVDYIKPVQEWGESLTVVDDYIPNAKLIQASIKLHNPTLLQARKDMIYDLAAGKKDDGRSPSLQTQPGLDMAEVSQMQNQVVDELEKQSEKASESEKNGSESDSNSKAESESEKTEKKESE